ncbi:GntR family transcriptional regulator [Clostridium sp. D2Q-14]|uniref:GntR family transcriptional regulator n=1 Tax=Anaeromonas gelatinilytica TaxID=2683194 RepID=UPI00193B2501|nr:GntR family transcriptional regulator [Anaeromonas gelatinilytica]MBS4535455.1 GntR family transcriptional regulator [Anaeromonas gelatinilytica]
MKTPIYIQIKEKIQKEIQYKNSNDAIESERDLSKRLNASRMTVRKAIDELVEEGYLYREKNKGTFVSDKSLWKKNTSVINSEDEKLEYRLINFDVKYSIKDDVLELLGLTDNDSFSIIRAIRVVIKDRKPQNVEEFYIIRSFIDEKNINRFNKLLDLNGYLKDSTMTQKFIPITVPTQYASTLNLDINTPIIMVEGVVRKKSGTPYIYYKSYNNPKEKIIEITI